MARKEAKDGKDDYRKLIESNSYYVDKTLLIEEFLKNDAEVTLITRPRRFGKTLNMTMMREFFDITIDSKDIFEGTKIMDKHECVKFMNKVPVVFLTFKGCNGSDMSIMLEKIARKIKKEYDKYYNILSNSDKVSSLSFEEFEKYAKQLKERKESDLIKTIDDMLPVLTKLLYEHYEVKPIVLIDEYDNPFIEAKLYGYYNQIKTTLADIYGELFKGNEYIDKGIMTGIQKIAQESIFSKFNNPSICTVINPKYCDKFGLTKDETKEYLEHFGFELNDRIKDYYDGYRIGNQDKELEKNVIKLHEKGINDKKVKLYEAEIYNPMSITSYISNSGALETYWVNTSTNSLIKKEISNASDDFFEGFNDLIEKGECITDIDMNTTFAENQTTYTLWGLLLNAGYITVKEVEYDGSYKICIPNDEVRSEFKKIVAEYTQIGINSLKAMFRALENKRMSEFAKVYKKIVMTCTSYFDANSKENSYHMLMLGMAAYLVPRFKVESNKERGTGRPDIAIYKKRPDDLNVIIEYKHDEEGNVENNSKHLLKDAKEALEQIKEKKYYTDMDGEVMLIGIAHNKKEVEVLYELIKVKDDTIVQ